MIKMKDSGYSYIGNIPENWEVTRNKNVFSCTKELVGNKSNSTQLLSLTTKGVKEKDINNPEGKLPESFDTYQYVNTNDIVMCLFDLDVSAVFSGISPFDGMISPAYRVLTCKKNIVPKFADYWFKYISDGRKFNHYAKNIRYTLNYEDFSSLPIVFPPLETQHRIADYLDEKCAKIDAIIEKQQAVIEKLKEYKLSVITEAVTKGLNPDVVMKDSCIEWIGDIPAHWDVINIGKTTTKVGSGKTPSGGAETYTNKGILFLRSQNVYDTGLVLDEPTYISEETDEDMKNTRVLPYDVLLNITGGSIGRCCVFYPEFGRANVNQHVSIIRVKKDLVIPQYMHYYWISNLGHTAIALYQTGGNREGMSADAIKKSPITLPPISEQSVIASFLDKKCSEIDKITKQKQSIIDKILSYKKSLIYEVVTGKKEV